MGTHGSGVAVDITRDTWKGQQGWETEGKRRLAEAVNSANFRFAELTLDKDNGHLWMNTDDAQIADMCQRKIIKITAGFAADLFGTS